MTDPEGYARGTLRAGLRALRAPGHLRFRLLDAASRFILITERHFEDPIRARRWAEEFRPIVRLILERRYEEVSDPEAFVERVSRFCEEFLSGDAPDTPPAPGVH